MTYVVTAFSESEIAYCRSNALRLARKFSSRSGYPVTVHVDGNFGDQCHVAEYSSGVAVTRPLTEAKILAALG